MEINSYLNKVNKSLSFLTGVTGVIGLSTYYWQKLNNPILLGINGIAFGLNSIVYFSYKNNTKNISAVSKILLGLSIISSVNYSKFLDSNGIKIIPKEISEARYSDFLKRCKETQAKGYKIGCFPIGGGWSEEERFELRKRNSDTENWNTYISMNVYGATNIINGITELLPKRFDSVKSIANLITAVALTSTGIVMQHTNGYDNYYAIPTVFSGMINIANQIIPSCLKKTENLKCDYQNESDNHDFDANEINNDENIPMNPISVTKSTIL